ncbi:MAG: dephospho-CoA kinase [Bacteriovorax sp.]|nr:dephospho-CoA kinase [Bacteriovorax sp.]
MKSLKNNLISKNASTRLYHLPVPIIGLTGGIGTGKSTVARILADKGIPVIDADKLVKNIYQKHETVKFISHHFPDAIKDGTIDFKKLREIVFQDETAKKLVEDYIYAYLPIEFKKSIEELINPLFIVYDVPLLFEKKLNELVDISVCVYAPKKIQIKRIVSRDKSSTELAQKILENQMDIEQKKVLADFVISNTESQEQLIKLVDQFLNSILNR